MKRMLIICPSPKGTNPGQRLKYEQYIPSWERTGYTIRIASFQTPRFWNIVYKRGYTFEKIIWTLWGYIRRTFLLFQLPFYDAVYIYMAVTPFGPPLFEWLVFQLNPKVLFDIEDMAFLNNTSPTNTWIKKLKGTRKYLFLIKHAKHVITSTPMLGNYVERFNKNHTAITATFNSDRFVPRGFYSQSDKLVIGWTGSHSTLQYLHLLDNVFIRLVGLMKFKLRVICDTPYHCDGVEVENIKWSEAAEITDLQGIDVGVYPVPCTEWVLGKSGCKTITYMFIGIPSVSTAFGNVTSIIEHGKDGYLAKTDEDWVEYLLLLNNNKSLRRIAGMRAREKAVKLFSVESNVSIYSQILHKVM